jgi:hypothetical protein
MAKVTLKGRYRKREFNWKVVWGAVNTQMFRSGISKFAILAEIEARWARKRIIRDEGG